MNVEFSATSDFSKKARQKLSVSQMRSDSESDHEMDASVHLQILQELRWVNKHLDAVQDQVAGPSSSLQIKGHH